ncbi:hypothetical protein KGQ19_01940 [Catenulispora sp. NL8]|uniref:Secreted protein n=1 Tax=Catenulispora pinistramenti TaxID=2705254 RepID=A0ABS5KJT3_9ACTN|nr:hypothetical protein [Catenulispora pinistramenti]MBS2545621.1 hypothetical protein [Catenulispora pinistramenti]
MSRICRRSTALISALTILVGVLCLSLGHSVPAAPRASAAISRASVAVARDQIQAQREVALGADDQVVADELPVVEPATFIHHMIIGPDSAEASQQPQPLTC